MAVSSGSVRVKVGNCSEGRPALGSWCGIKRIEGRCLTAPALSAPPSACSAVVGAGAEAGVGPLVLRTVSCGAVVSARVLVMLAGGEAGGDSLAGGGGGCGCSCGCPSAVTRLERVGGRAMGRLWDEEANAGEAGGVWVEARGRVLGVSRGSSPGPGEWRCRLRKKLMPRCRPVGRGEGDAGEAVERAVAATVGGAGVGAVNIAESPVGGATKVQ